MAMGMGVRMGVIVGVGRYHPRMLYCNTWEVYQAAPASPRIKASPANKPIIDKTSDPSTYNAAKA
jgi:hypothetical protein